tara:strand:+ start:864 stop:1517 length:654 start_codon:yes stop_codon:yes gene_type:complete
MEDTKTKKKRGRKPKNQTIDKEKEVNKVSENKIIRLKKTNEEVSNISGYELNQTTDIIDETNNVGEVCWNCCHSFHEMVYGVPLKYVDGVFYVYGDFCSLECAARYSSEHFHNDNYEITPLINLYNNIINKSENKINPAPNKLSLKLFGGNLIIDEYRSCFKKPNIHDIKLPPILPIKHITDTFEINSGNSKSNLKLYRKKPLPSENKSISVSMNLN